MYREVYHLKPTIGRYAQYTKCSVPNCDSFVWGKMNIHEHIGSRKKNQDELLDIKTLTFILIKGKEYKNEKNLIANILGRNIFNSLIYSFVGLGL